MHQLIEHEIEKPVLRNSVIHMIHPDPSYTFTFCGIPEGQFPPAPKGSTLPYCDECLFRAIQGGAEQLSDGTWVI